MIAKGEFAVIKKYLITKPELCDRLVTVNTNTHQIVGYPVDIPGSKYPRNHLIFNLAFVFDADAETASYEPAVRKLAWYLRGLEVESGFMVNVQDAFFQAIIDTLRMDLNSEGRSTVHVNDATTIHISYIGLDTINQVRASTTEYVPEHMVAVMLCDAAAIPTAAFDWTVETLLPFIDGVKYVKCLSIESDIELPLVQKVPLLWPRNVPLFRLGPTVHHFLCCMRWVYLPSVFFCTTIGNVVQTE